MLASKSSLAFATVGLLLLLHLCAVLRPSQFCPLSIEPTVWDNIVAATVSVGLPDPECPACLLMGSLEVGQKVGQKVQEVI
jgi:hypothetical protein